MLELPDVAKTVNETKLGKTRLRLGEAVVPATSGLLEMAVCSGIADTVFVKGMAETPPVPSTPATEDVEIDGNVDDGCGKEYIVKDDKE